MYTTYRLPPIDTLSDHTGLMIMSILCVILLICFIVNYFNDWKYNSLTDAEGTIIAIIIVLFIWGVSAFQSYTSGEYREYVNTPIEAELVSFFGEQHQEEQRSGKSTRIVTVANQYVTYRVPDGLVSFKVYEGQAWPEKAVLYKN